MTDIPRATDAFVLVLQLGRSDCESANHIAQQSLHADIADRRFEQQLVQGNTAECTRRW